MTIKEIPFSQQYQNAIVLPRGMHMTPGLYDREGSFVEYSGKRSYGGGRYDYTDQKLALNEIEERNETVYYFGDLRGHWGHFLIDEASRLWKLEEIDESIRIVCFLGCTTLPKWYTDFLGLLGITKERLLVIDKPTRFTSVLYCAPAYISGLYISPKYREVFMRAVSGNNASCPSSITEGCSFRLYLSRSMLPNSVLGHDYGERTIESILRDNGFEILHPEHMSLADQVWMYSHAEMIIATNGTLAHNVLFSKPDIQLVILDRIHRDDILGAHQRAISMLFDKPPICIRCSHPKSNHTVSFLRMTPEMKESFKENQIEDKHHVKHRMEFCLAGIGYFVNLCLYQLKLKWFPSKGA